MSHQHQRTACLVDGDNMARGGQLSLDVVSDVLRRLADVTRGCPVAFAMQRRLAIDYMTAYVELGWGIKFASMAPDAADKELLDAADEFVRHGVRDLVVASGDHAFAALAGQTRLHVICYQGSLSRELRMTASSVTYLDDVVASHAA